ncbi:Abi family protein [Asaia sp. SF2.1]|uniref:Abi family protein n=1 Tax=Asaia sp. SF2.1 TaxID=406101 RepID=UPI001F46CA70|nr:Abi family protein [Asaia sp. SF2.1]
MDQLALLMDRGLIVTDKAKAIEHLQRIGYGRLAPYWQPFQKMALNPGGSAPRSRLDVFQAGAEFRHAVDLYLFDKKLRLIFLDALERIEVALRVDLAHALGRRNPWAHRDSVYLDVKRANLVPYHNKYTRHQNWLDHADRALDRSKDDWLREFSATYSSPVPIWMAVEVWDFGTLSKLLEMSCLSDRFAIASRYGLLPDTLVSWIKALAFVRNICAHHGRLWNTGIVNQPKVPKIDEAPGVLHIRSASIQRSKVYGSSTVASHLVKKINPSTSWSSRMKKHWLHFPKIPFVSAEHGGFVSKWEVEEIWS